MKEVYLDVAGKMHSLYRELISCPPEGYTVTAGDVAWDRATTGLTKSAWLYSFQERLLNKAVPVNLLKAYLEKSKKPPTGTDLTYATGHLVFRREPWVVDLEFVTQLTGYSLRHLKRYRGLIERKLSSQDCKRIICWTEAGKRTVLQNLDPSGFADKVETVPLAVPKKEFVRDYSRKKATKLLFVGSANIRGQFDIDGGKEVIEAFLSLQRSYPDLELAVRSDVPKELAVKYNHAKNLRMITELIPWEELAHEFQTADIFLFPAHTTPGMVILDAMSYELPVITTDVWANPEMVHDGQTGFVVRKSGKVKYYSEDFIPNFSHLPGSSFMKSIQAVDHTVVQELVEKTRVLIDDRELRRRMARAGREQVETGRFSLEKRNEKLKSIFDEAVRGPGTVETARTTCTA